MDRSQSLQRLFERANRLRRYPKGSIIIMQGGSLDEAYRIIAGLVKVYDIDSSGSQRTVALYAKGHIMPASWLLSEKPPGGALFFYEAFTEVQCYTLPRDELRAFIDNHPKIARFFADAATKAYLNATARIQNLQRSNVGERVDFILYYLAKILGQPSEQQGTYMLEIAVTHQIIADLAGLARESVSNQLKKAKYNKIFYKRDSGTLINISGLDTEAMPKLLPLKI